MSESFSCLRLDLRWCSWPPCASGLTMNRWRSLAGVLTGLEAGFSGTLSAVVVEAFLLGGWGFVLSLKLEPRGRWGTSIAFLVTSFVENMRVSLSFMEDFSAGFGRASWDELPLVMGWPFCGVKRGDFLPSDLTDEGLELAAEAVVGLAIAGEAEGMSGTRSSSSRGVVEGWRARFGVGAKGGRGRYIRKCDRLVVFRLSLFFLLSLFWFRLSVTDGWCQPRVGAAAETAGRRSARCCRGQRWRIMRADEDWLAGGGGDSSLSDLRLESTREGRRDSRLRSDKGTLWRQERLGAVGGLGPKET